MMSRRGPGGRPRPGPADAQGWLTRRRPAEPRIDARGARGQALAEFALILPIFLVLLMGVLEFGFVLNAVLGTNFAARDAALLAAEAGNAPGADCVILQSVENDVSAPASDTRILQVEIYRSDHNGGQIGGSSIYSRSGSTTCTYPRGPSVTVPYTLTAAGYTESDRCNYLGGCPDLGRTELDTIGVSITYHYNWHTPLAALLQMLPGHGVPPGAPLPAPGYTIVKSSVMRMEPVL
jgi:Flp pilus assembly protein TadG